MALSAFKLNQRDVSTRKITREYIATLSAVAGSGYLTGGETLDFTAATNPNRLERPRPPANPLPQNEDFIVTRVPAGFDAVISRAAASPTLKNFIMQIFTSGGTELTQADYPAGLAGLTIAFTVRSKKRNG